MEKEKKDSNSKGSTKKKASSSSKKTTTSKKTSSAKSSTTTKKNKLNIPSDIYNKIVDETSIVFLYPKTIELLKTNSSLQSIINFFINVVYSYEQENNVTDAKANDFKTAFSSITNKEIKLSLVSKEDVEEIDDKMSFLVIFIKNTLNLDWTSIVDSFKQKKDTERVVPVQATEQEKANINNNAENFNTANNFNFNDNTYFNGEEFMRRNNVSFDQIADSAIQQQASMLLRKDIIENKFYQYNSKPTIFVILKWLLFSFWIITAIGIVINSFSFVGVNEGNYFFAEQAGFTFAPEYSTLKDFNNAISNKGMLLSIGGVANILGYVLSLLFPFLIAYYAYNQIKNNKNDNAKFTCKTFITWILLIWLIFIIFQDMNNLSSKFDVAKIQSSIDLNIPNQTTVIKESSDITVNINNSLVGKALLINSISFIIYVSSAGLSTILSVAIIITRPKIDANRMQEQINYYANEIKSGRIPFDANSLSGIGGSRNPFSPF